jgi:hypothetical protein
MKAPVLRLCGSPTTIQRRSAYAVLVDANSEDGDFVCECEDTTCFKTIQLTLREYAALRLAAKTSHFSRRDTSGD